MKKNEPMTIVFVASTPRSGSTLVDRLVSNNNAAVTLGELKNLEKYLNLSPGGAGSTRDWVCRCGNRLQDCPFWSEVISRYESNTGQDPKKMKTEVPTIGRKNAAFLFAQIGSLLAPSAYLNEVNRRFYDTVDSERATRNCFETIGAVKELTGKTTAIDSSKRAEQLYSLKKHLPKDFEIKVIHIVRDGRAVANSVRKRCLEAGVKASFNRAVLSWVIENAMIHNLRPMFKKNEFVRIRYEDLCSDTERTIVTICNELELEYDPLMKEIGESEKHNIGGTPRAFDEKTEIRLDRSWGKELSTVEKRMFQVTAGLFNKYMGY
jgi:hypothetical protein